MCDVRFEQNTWAFYPDGHYAPRYHRPSYDKHWDSVMDVYLTANGMTVKYLNSRLSLFTTKD